MRCRRPGCRLEGKPTFCALAAALSTQPSEEHKP